MEKQKHQSIASASPRGGELTHWTAPSALLRLISCNWSCTEKICGGNFRLEKTYCKTQETSSNMLDHHRHPTFQFLTGFFFSHLLGEGRRCSIFFWLCWCRASNQSQPGCPTWCTCLEYIRKSLAYRHPLQGWLPLHLRVKMDAQQNDVDMKLEAESSSHVTAVCFGQQMFSCWNCGVRDILKRLKFPLAEKEKWRREVSISRIQHNNTICLWLSLLIIISGYSPQNPILVQTKMPWSGGGATVNNC